MTNFNAIDLDALVAQREEATGIVDGRVPFTFKGQTFTFMDPITVSDEKLAEIVDSDFGPDVCIEYMGEEEYVRFVEAGGNSSLWGLAFKAYLDKADEQGKGKRLNRFARRSAGRKR